MIQDNLDNISDNLSQGLPSDVYEEAVKFCKTRAEREFLRTRTVQTNKMDKLIQRRDENHRNKRDKQLENLKDTYQKKWVVNLSDTALTPAETSVLVKGPKFAITPEKIPAKDYIVLTEASIKDLSDNDKDNTRHEVTRLLNKAKVPNPNITSAEARALKGLRKDPSRMVLTADKGNCFVVMDTTMYKSKCQEVLSDKAVYEKLPSDPTAKSQKKLCNLLKGIKQKGELSQTDYQHLRPTGNYSTPPKFYGSPKIHKQGIPMRGIVSSIGSMAYKTAKLLARILKYLVGKNQHSVNSTKEFIERMQLRIVGDDECYISFDIMALFSNTPIPKAMEVTQRRLENDNTLSQRTDLSVQSIMSLLEFCVNNTYFLFDGEFYKQTHGAAMGSPVSPILANIFMEYFEVEAITTAPTPPRFWDRYVDDTWALTKKGTVQELHDHINDIEKPFIRFTKEEPGPDGGVPFLDTYIMTDDNGNIITRVYRKPTHTDLYLNWNSHHPVCARMGVIRTLYHRAQLVCSTEDILHEEQKHLRDVLRINDYPEWAIHRGQKQIAKDKASNPSSKDKKDYKGFVVVPYVKGLSEPYKRSLEKVGVQVFFKAGCTLRNMLVSPKDKDSKSKTQGIIYNIKCGENTCPMHYIGETGRTLEERYKDHVQDSNSAIHRHSAETGHSIPELDEDNVKILRKEDNTIHRRIIEGMYIKLHEPELNRNIGKVDIPNIYDNLLREEGSLKISRGGHSD